MLAGLHRGQICEKSIRAGLQRNTVHDLNMLPKHLPEISRDEDDDDNDN